MSNNEVTKTSLNLGKIAIVLLVLQILAYVSFVISHFLIWGFTTYFPIIAYPFIGLDLTWGLISLTGMHFYFLLAFINYTFYIRPRKEDYRHHWFINIAIVAICIVLFIETIIEVFLGWEFESLAQLDFGFYLWLCSVLFTLGILLYLNFKPQNFKQLWLKPAE